MFVIDDATGTVYKLQSANSNVWQSSGEEITYTTTISLRAIKLSITMT